MKDELLYQIINNPDHYGPFYAKNAEAVFAYVKSREGLKSDTFITDFKKDLDQIRFSVVFSDFTNIYPVGMGNGATVELKQNQTITLNSEMINAVVAEGGKPILHAGYIIRDPNELTPFLRAMEPLVESEKAIIHNNRLVIGLTNRVPKDGNGRLWKSWDVSTDSPIGNWLSLESAGNQNSIPIDFKPVDLSAKDELFNLTIPYLRGIKLSELVQILNDNHDLISSFRTNVKELVTKANSDNTNIEELKNDIVQPQIDEINRKFKLAANIRALKLGGTVLGSTALGLMSFPVTGFGPVISSFLGTGGLGLTVKHQVDYLKEIDKLKDNPMYLLWKLKKK